MYCKIDKRRRLLDFYNWEGKFVESLSYEEAVDLIHSILSQLESDKRITREIKLIPKEVQKHYVLIVP